MRIAQLLLPPAVLAVALSGLTGCAAATPGASAPMPTPGVTSTTGPATPAPAEPAAPPTSDPAAPSAPIDAGGTDPACSADQLELRIERRPDGGGAGSTAVILTYHNIGARSCGLEGHPTIALLSSGRRIPVGASSRPVDDLRDADGVVVPVEASAYSTVYLASAGALACTPVPVDAIRVTVPGQREAAAVVMPLPDPVQGCREASAQVVTSGAIGPVFPG